MAYFIGDGAQFRPAGGGTGTGGALFSLQGGNGSSSGGYGGGGGGAAAGPAIYVDNGSFVPDE
jgi:hypothetical protein